MKKKVLLIEDDAALAKIITIKLRLRDIEVIAAADGHEGLDALKEDPDLVWLDLYMPRMNGAQFLEAAQQLPGFRGLPVIIVSVSHIMLSNVLQKLDLTSVNIVTSFIKTEVPLENIVRRADEILSGNRATA